VSSGTIGSTFYSATGAVQLAEKLFGPSAADVIVTPATAAMSPGAIVVTFDVGIAKTVDLDKWTFKANGLAR
jgi:hypothetical protein